MKNGEERSMSRPMIRGAVSLLKWILCGAGVLAVVLLALLATPLQPVPELQSISRARASVDFSSLPAIERFQGRDGTWLGFRHYGAGGAPTGRVAIVIHGSSGSSGGTIHALSQALAAHGVETFAVDMRGHGTSGTRGDIGYVGQLEDDLADFVAVLRKTVPSAPLTLVGHSSGGGFGLRVAGSPIQNLFERFVLLAPYLGYDAPSTRPSSGGWARADIPRIIGLLALRSLGITCCEALPVLALAVPPNSEKTLVSTYTDRLMRNFAVRGDFRHDLAAATKPLTIISGADDEVMFSDKYAEAVRGAKVAVEVMVLDGINHMGIVAAPKAVSIIAEDVATRAMAGS
jgi:alpha-beta hydrolase superfamily lysophospholipase